MSAGKNLFTFVAGIASGLAIAYYVDPKGSQKKLQKIERELKKNRKKLDKKLAEYKGAYNKLVDKYATSSKDMIDSAKGMVDSAKNSAKAKEAS